ncbi:unnamed protein product [Mytilus edulis]|uniref:Zinc finger PHD-type domain-containing protein n=1 Tax=Mytilus edulis TaxID=6550 RepID=A0A8S3UD14_MYTED|nr:unnamed protein product [Mytilus edulis]
MKDNHGNFEMKDIGLVLNSKFPYLGASPDEIANCDCCGEICIEIKCPYRKRDVKLDAALDKRDCLEMRDADFHAESIEIDNDLCDTLLVKSKLFFSNAILPELVGKLYSKPSVDTSVNTEVRDQALAACSSVPLRDTCVNVDNSINSCDNSRTGSSRLIICICQKEYNPEKDDVIGCDNENCPYIWFHFKCAKIKRVPKGDWMCLVGLSKKDFYIQRMSKRTARTYSKKIKKNI